MVKASSLFQLGMDLECSPRKTQKEGSLSHHSPAPRVDHFVSCKDIIFAGTHLIVDFWNASYLDDKEYIEKIFREAVAKSGAQLLLIHVHRFTFNGGISGVAILAESHISIHTWPERNYAALDIFMCGEAKPYKAVEVLKRSFNPQSVKITEIRRGRVE